MRKILSLFALIISLLNCKAQQVTIHGIAKDTTKSRSFVMVVVNDTLRKHKGEGYSKLLNNKYHVFADSKGKYTIKAQLTDTLYFYSNKYFTQKYKVADIVKRKIDVQLEPEPCVPYVECKERIPTNLYIFVGEKVSMQYEPEPNYCMMETLDGGMKSVYKIKENIYGQYPKDTIEFKAYDHYGRVMFGYYDTVLLFVGEYCGKLYQEKYQFFDLYKTKDGRWASPGDPYKFDKYQENKTVAASSIEFDPFIRINTIPPYDEQYPERFQKYETPYYRIIGDKAFPLMGAYIEDLIKVKMKGFLKQQNIVLEKEKFQDQKYK